jgi:hypothetical protein
MTREALTAIVRSRLDAASAPGCADEPAFEAARCLDAIDEHEANPRDFSADFIAQQWARVDALVGIKPIIADESHTLTMLRWTSLRATRPSALSRQIEGRELRPWQESALAPFVPVIDWSEVDLGEIKSASDPGRVQCVAIHPPPFSDRLDPHVFAKLREPSTFRAVRLACVPPSRRFAP